MKALKYSKLLLLIAFLLLSIQSFSQKIAIENKKFNVAYPLIGNYLTVVVENVSCKELIVTTDNGIIQGSNCEYEYIPEKVGIAKIYIRRKVKSDTLILGERQYRIKRFPKQTARINYQVSGKIAAGMLKAQEGIRVPVEGFDIDMNISVKRFTMKIVRNNEVICDLSNEGTRFNEAIRSELAKIRTGDKVYFEDIYALMPGMKQEEKLNVIDLEVE